MLNRVQNRSGQDLNTTGLLLAECCSERFVCLISLHMISTSVRAFYSIFDHNPSFLIELSLQNSLSWTPDRLSGISEPKSLIFSVNQAFCNRFIARLDPSLTWKSWKCKNCTIGLKLSQSTVVMGTSELHVHKVWRPSGNSKWSFGAQSIDFQCT